MQAIGVDLIEIERVQKVAQKYPSFLLRFFTENEISLCRRKSSFYVSLAARFAAKEAISKALGLNLFSLCWQEIEILADTQGRPCVLFHGTMQKQIGQAQITKVMISLSHSQQMAIAMATVE